MNLQPELHPTNRIKNANISPAILSKIIPSSRNIATNVSQILKKEEGNYIPEIFAYEARYLSSRNRSGTKKQDVRFGLRCKFCNTVFKYITFFNSQHWQKCSRRYYQFNPITFAQLSQDDKFYFFISFLLAKFIISAHQFAKKDIQDIFKYFMSTPFDSAYF